jgi:hypothetical protein
MNVSIDWFDNGLKSGSQEKQHEYCNIEIHTGGCWVQLHANAAATIWLSHPFHKMHTCLKAIGSATSAALVAFSNAALFALDLLTLATALTKSLLL